MMDNIVARIEKLKPHPTEAIVLGFNFNDINAEIQYKAFKEDYESWQKNLEFLYEDD